MASPGSILHGASFHAIFKSDNCKPLVEKIERAYEKYINDSTPDNKLKLRRLMLEPYAKMYEGPFAAEYKRKIYMTKMEYSELVSEIIFLIAKTCEGERFDKYINNYDREKSTDHSFLMYFHSMHKEDFNRIAAKYYIKEIRSGISGVKELNRDDGYDDEDKEHINPVDIAPGSEADIPGSDANEERIKDNLFTTLHRYSDALAEVKISDNKKRLYSIDVTYEWLAGLYKKDSPDIGKTSFMRSISNDFNRFKTLFAQASAETLEVILTVARMEKRFPTKGDVVGHLGMKLDYVSGKSKEVKTKIDAYIMENPRD